MPIERAHTASPTPIAYVAVVLCPWTVEHVRVVSPPSRDVLRARSRGRGDRESTAPHGALYRLEYTLQVKPYSKKGYGTEFRKLSPRKLLCNANGHGQVVGEVPPQVGQDEQISRGLVTLV